MRKEGEKRKWEKKVRKESEKINKGNKEKKVRKESEKRKWDKKER